MAKTTTVQIVRDRFAPLVGLTADNFIDDDAQAFLGFLNLAIDSVWMRAEWPFCMRIFQKTTDSAGLVDLSSDVSISECIRAYDTSPRIASNSSKQYRIESVEDADQDGVLITEAGASATVYLNCRIVTPEYTLLTDTIPLKLGAYLAYKVSADWLRQEGQEDKANKRLAIAEGVILNEIERLERQQNQNLPTVVETRIAGIK